MKISYDDLVTYALFSILKKEGDSTFENLVKESFLLFPSRFQLIGYPFWPDSALINKCWLRCRSDKAYIIGNTARGFNLTPIGVKIAERVHAKLTPSNPDSYLVQRKGDERTKAGKFVKHIENSRAYNLFKQSNYVDIMPLDFFELIFCTPDSLPETKRQNLEEIKQYVELYKRDDLKRLLQFCETKFRAELESGKRGGMMKRKGSV